MKTGELMADWTGPVDEAYFAERSRRINGGSGPAVLFDDDAR